MYYNSGKKVSGFRTFGKNTIQEKIHSEKIPVTISVFKNVQNS